MRIFVSLSGKEQIVKGSRIAIRQGKDYWLATVTRRSSDGTVSLQYDEGTKDSGVSLRSATHLPDNAKTSKKPLTKEQVAVIVEKGKAAAAKLKAAAEKAKTKPVSPIKTKTTVKPSAPAPKEPAAKAVKEPAAKAVKKETLSDLHDRLRQLDEDRRADNKRAPLSAADKKWYDEARKAITEKIKKLSPAPAKEANELSDAADPKSSAKAMTNEEVLIHLVGDAKNFVRASDHFSIIVDGKTQEIAARNLTRPVSSVSEMAKKMVDLGWEEKHAKRSSTGRALRRIFVNPKSGQYMLLRNDSGYSRRGRNDVIRSSGKIVLFDKTPPKEITSLIESTKEDVDAAKQQVKDRNSAKRASVERRHDVNSDLTDTFKNPPSLGDLSKADPRDVKAAVSKVLSSSIFLPAREFVAEKSKLSVHPLSMAAHTDFEMGPDRLKKQAATMIDSVTAIAEKAGLTSEKTKRGFKLSSKLGSVEFIVEHKPFHGRKSGLLMVTPV